jgi:hypothetical protein
MIVLPEYALKTLMTQIVTARHAMTDAAGNPISLGTVDEKTMRMAALVAMQILVGELVFPGDRKILVRRPKRQTGIFEEEE